MMMSDGTENIGLLFSWLLLKKRIFKLTLEFPLISVVQNERAKLKKKIN